MKSSQRTKNHPHYHLKYQEFEQLHHNDESLRHLSGNFEDRLKSLGQKDALDYCEDPGIALFLQIVIEAFGDLRRNRPCSNENCPVRDEAHFCREKALMFLLSYGCRELIYTLSDIHPDRQLAWFVEHYPEDVFRIITMDPSIVNPA